MIVLNSTADLLRVVTTTTADIKVHASWVDLLDNATTAIPGRTNTATINTATTTTVVAASGVASTKRTVNFLSIRNKHASAVQVVTVLHSDGSIVNEITPDVSLAAGECLVNDHGTWFVYDITGAVRAAAGVAATTLTAGVVELATNPEALTGTATDKAITPSAMSTIWKSGGTVASAGTLVLGDGGYFHISGTTGITDIDFTDPADGRAARLVFDGVLTITHNGTTLILPGAANITTAVGDSCLVVQDAGDNVKMTQYQRVAPTPLTNPNNQSTAAQAISAATSTYITGSSIAIPTSLLRIGTRFRWVLDMTKGAVGTASRQFFVRLGTTGAVGDAAIITITSALGTAVVDQARVTIDLTIRGPLSASCIARALYNMDHQLPATGFMTVKSEVLQVTSGTFNATTAALIIGLSVTTGAAETLSIEQCMVDSYNL